MPTALTLNRRVPAPDFGMAVASYVHTCADQAKRSLAGSAVLRKSLPALADFHNYVVGLGPEDPRLVTLYELWQARRDGGSERFDFQPTIGQERLLATLSKNQPPPPPETTMNEFVMAGVCDQIEGYAELRHSVQVAGEEKLSAEDALASERNRIRELQDAIGAAEERAETAQADREELQAEIKFLRSFIPDEPEKAAKPSKPRRTKVEGHVGIWLAPNGEDYEIIYPNGEGGNAYETVGPDLEQAIALRAERVSKKEPVAA